MSRKWKFSRSQKNQWKQVSTSGICGSQNNDNFGYILHEKVPEKTNMGRTRWRWRWKRNRLYSRMNKFMKEILQVVCSEQFQNPNAHMMVTYNLKQNARLDMMWLFRE